MSGSDETTLLVRNLRDAGCGSQLIAKILILRKNGDFREQLRLLTHQRFSLLSKLHAAQQKVDCLDYLVFQIKQENSTKSRRQQ